jgi:hypothetical protein
MCIRSISSSWKSWVNKYKNKNNNCETRRNNTHIHTKERLIINLHLNHLV